MTQYPPPGTIRGVVALIIGVATVANLAATPATAHDVTIDTATVIDTSGLGSGVDLSIRDVSRDGRRVLLGGSGAGSTSQEVLDVASGQVVPVPHGAAMSSAGRFAVGPDPMTANRLIVVDIDADTTGTFGVDTPNGFLAQPVAISDDGHTVLINEFSPFTASRSLVVLDLESGDQHRIANPARETANLAGIRLSPNGRTVDYTARAGVTGSVEIWTWERSSDLHRLRLSPEDFPTANQSFTISPGFEFIRFEVPSGVHLRRVATGEDDVLPTSLTCCVGSLADDGTAAFVARLGDDPTLHLWLWRPAHDAEIVSLGREDLARHRTPTSAAIAGDGRTLYFVVDDPTTTDGAQLWARTIDHADPEPIELEHVSGAATARAPAVRLDR